MADLSSTNQKDSTTNIMSPSSPSTPPGETEVNSNNFSGGKLNSSQEQNTTTVPIYNAHHNHASCDDPSHNHFHEESSLPSNSSKTKTRRSDRKKAKDYVRSELLPGHRGSENIDDLVKFIESQSPTTTITDTTKTDEKKKRNNKK
ncbi:unnamed protein product [Didymodactylos carnosus]|uniref:Uncharacterized protein n=1 Tax=Didymodactylos carnosus TaxID=1234261 RepID=A0A814BGK2_9BILA|nr:unnamed protein product [Didymodactylos carnosus]CAF0926629.1 unnamed protein product [Didymodactylos carnosus]CAF3617918.1 unnamed protein product [Didymodactylos carnosus]CAF3705146.1 unnamed protein product [Didymodactylos carnosus]